MIQVKKDFQLEAFEGFLSDLSASTPQELSLPNEIKSNAIGSVSALIQLIVTWSRRRVQGDALRLYAENETDKSAENFANTPFGLVALNMARNIRSLNGSKIERRDALRNAIAYVKSMHSGHLAELREFDKSIIPLICVDNASDLRRPIRLYKRNADEVLGRSAFESLVKASFTELQRVKEVSPEQVSDIGTFVYEAFLNTHEHAQTDELGDRYLRSCRGILFAFQAIRHDKLGDAASGNHALKDYFHSINLRRSNLEWAHFAEVSVFDSGPGMAQSWLMQKGSSYSGAVRSESKLRNVSIQDEYDAVTSCLQKGATTKGAATTGNGLYRMMQVIKRNGGLIRLRSGRLSLIKSFHNAPASPISSDDLALVDISSGAIPASPRSWSEGTVVTAMLPLNSD